MSAKLHVLHEHNHGESCGTTNLSPLGTSDAKMFADKDYAGNALLVTLGCAKNLVDSEVMLGALRGRGFRVTSDAASADLIVVNTCAFLQSAVEEGVDRILEMAEYKKSGRCRRLVVAGCMVERYREDLQRSLPEVDQFISTDELLLVGEDVHDTAATFDAARRPYFLYDETMPRLRSTGTHTTFVKVAEGCDRPCTFCIIPKIRGGFRSRPLESIVSEIAALAADGVKEFNLVAQDMTAYGSDHPGHSVRTPRLAELLRTIDDALVDEQESWVRLLYAYPIGVTEELIRTIATSRVVCKYLDLPLQHIAHDVLKRMSRPLGERGTRGLIDQIRTLGPEIALRTTFIVGFPGETEADIAALEKFVSEGHFTHVGVFPYSFESEAKSAPLGDDVSAEEKSERVQRIMNAQKQVLSKKHAELEGKQLRVLLEGTHEESDLLLVGRNMWQAPETDGVVIVNDMTDELRDTFDGSSLSDLKGVFASVRVTGSTDYDLVATLESVDA